MRYHTWKAVVSRIKDLTSLVDVETQQQRVKNLIFKKAVDSIDVKTLSLEDRLIDVKNGMAELPCDLVRLLRTQEPTTGQNIKVRQDGSYLKAPYPSGQVRIHYYSLPYKDDEPIVHYDQIDYISYYVICVMMLDDVAMKKIDPAIYAEFKDMRDLEYHKHKASMRTISIEDMESSLWMMRNGLYLNPR